MKKLLEKFHEKFTRALNEGAGYSLFALAIVGIIFAIIGFYAVNGFSLVWFLCLHLPLYTFCGWALWQAFKMYQGTLKEIEKREEEHESTNKRNG